MNPASPHFAYFTRPNYFGMITADNQLVYNLDANTVQLDEGTAKGANLEKESVPAEALRRPGETLGNELY